MKIAACMMVKNEELMIRDCLESMLGLVDGISILDTGSTDRTVEIIEKFAADNVDQVQVILRHEEWNGHFAEMRNKSLEVLPEADWILIIDADERLMATGTREELDLALAEEVPDEADCLLVNLVYVEGDLTGASEYHARIFRADCGLHYTGRIHNQPHHPGKYWILDKLGLKHIGDDPSYGRGPAKLERRTRALKAIVQEGRKDPNRIRTPAGSLTEFGAEFMQAHYYLMHAYGQAGQAYEAARWAERYYLFRDELGDEWQRDTYMSAVRAYQKLADQADGDARKKKHLKAAMRWLQKGLAAMPHDMDLSLALSDQGIAINNIHMAAQGAHQYVDAWMARVHGEGQIDLKPVYSMDLSTFAHILHRLAMCRLRQGADALKELGLYMEHIDWAQRQPMIEQAAYNLPPIKQDINDFLANSSGPILVPGFEAMPGGDLQLLMGGK